MVPNTLTGVVDAAYLSEMKTVSLCKMLGRFHC
jgi:hypothetical protein